MSDKSVSDKSASGGSISGGFKISRRALLAAGAAIVASPGIVLGAKPTDEPVRVGLIGCGVRGWDPAAEDFV